jgi:hypothetical protein
VLVVFGGCWLSLRGQHPYTGHVNGSVIAIAVVLVAVNIGWTAWAIGRADTGVSHPVWGLYPASAPLLIIGLASTAAATAFRYWPLAGTALGIAVTAAAAGFGGPAGAWLITGIGLCAVYLGIAAFTGWRQRRSMVRP